MKPWLHDNDIKIYVIQSKEKFVVAERFIRTLKSKVYKHINAVYQKPDEIDNKYNNTYYRTIKIKPTDVKRDTFIDYGVEHKKEDPKFKFGDYVRIPKYKNIFAKDCTAN